MSHTSIHFILATVLFFSCGGATQPPRGPQAPPPSLCPSAIYTPSGDTMTMAVDFAVRLSATYDLVGYCLLLDGASLTTPDALSGSLAHLRAGEAMHWDGRVSRSGAHKLALVALIRGAGEASGYSLEVRSSHDFVLTGDPAPALRLVLMEKPGEPSLEKRPLVEWDANAATGRPPGWQPGTPEK
jgi:hypothetical protein